MVSSHWRLRFLCLKTFALTSRLLTSNCQPQVVTKTFHGAGIVVPVDKNDVGYRELPETDGETTFTFSLFICPNRKATLAHS